MAEGHACWCGVHPSHPSHCCHRPWPGSRMKRGVAGTPLITQHQRAEATRPSSKQSETDRPTQPAPAARSKHRIALPTSGPGGRMRRSGRDSSHLTPPHPSSTSSSEPRPRVPSKQSETGQPAAANKKQTQDIKTYLSVGRADSGHKENSVGNLHDE